jgi:hypothetical protein
LTFGQPAPGFLPDSAAHHPVGVQGLEKYPLRAAQRRGGGTPSRFRGLFQLGRALLGREGNRRRQEERGAENERSLRSGQAGIGSSRSTRGDKDSAPLSVTTMSSSIRTPKRPGR